MRSALITYSVVAVSSAIAVVILAARASAFTDTLGLRAKFAADQEAPAASRAAYWVDQADENLEAGQIEKAFDSFEKGIAAEPKESVLYQNLGTVTFLYRKDAAARYQLNEQQVLDRAFELYTKAMKLDPSNFALAVDVAATYYGVNPPRPQQAVQAWKHAVSLATTDLELESAYLHLARTEISAGLLEEANESLRQVKNGVDADMKELVARRLQAALAE